MSLTLNAQNFFWESEKLVLQVGLENTKMGVEILCWDTSKSCGHFEPSRWRKKISPNTYDISPSLIF